MLLCVLEYRLVECKILGGSRKRKIQKVHDHVVALGPRAAKRRTTVDAMVPASKLRFDPINSTRKPQVSSPGDSSEAEPTDVKPSLSDDAFPPVEAPTAGFILQLFFIPMIIVSIIVVVWLMFSWMAHMGSNPKDLVKQMKKGDKVAWQRAGILADLLQDPRKEHLKRDAQLAGELSSALQQQIKAGQKEQHQIKLRIFLCRALGEFHIEQVLPGLLEAASVERDSSNIDPPDTKEEKRKLTEIDVRRSALEAIAVLVKNVGPEKLADNQKLLDVLVSTSKERGDPARDEHQRRELRSTSAYVMGILGSEEALARLERLLDDSYANTRYNAATGLARHGDVRAIPELVEMLDPNNDDAVKDERHESAKSFKRSLVITNGIQAANLLVKKNVGGDLSKLEDALKKLAAAEKATKVGIEATEALDLLRKRNQSL